MIQYMAWPGAILIFGLVFIFIFKRDISSLFMRVQKISKDGIQASITQTKQDDTEKKSSADELMKSFDSVVLLEKENLIKADLQQKGLSNNEAVDVLARHLAATQLALHFEYIYSTIWGSQLRLLRYLNSQAPVGDTAENLKAFYDAAAITYPQVYEDYSFENYLGFLLSRILIKKVDGNYGITNFGRDFLIYLIQTGKSEARGY